MTFSHQPSAISPDTVRLWRVRKDRRWIDAHLMATLNAVELRFRLDGEPMFSQRFATRALAVEDAERRLRDLQRVGWTTHW
jgi:hypothetical protein